tara:strand:- start:60 stop:581 length:522 start_codon:yes stop_codon:yes gene_type:complete
MNKTLFDDKVNYIELYVINKKQQGCIDTDLPDNKFNRIFENVKKLRYKNFKKTNVKTYNSKMEYIAEDNNENVYDFIIHDSQQMALNNLDFINLRMKKNQKSTYMFPSNKNIYDMISCYRHTFKINNLVYLNFQISEDYDGNIIKEIFFNINYGRACDENLLINLIEDTIKGF